MAIRALTMDQVQDYVSDLDPSKGTDKEADEATVFKLGTLSARQMTQIKDASTSFKPDRENSEDPKNPDMVAEFRPNQSVYLTVQFALRGWDRFVDFEGNEVAFKTIKKQLGGKEILCAHDDALDRLGQELMRELSEAIEKFNTPTEIVLKT